MYRSSDVVRYVYYYVESAGYDVDDLVQRLFHGVHGTRKKTKTKSEID